MNGLVARITMSYMNALTVRIPEELERRLDEICRRESRSASEIVRESIRRFVDQRELDDLRQRLRPYAEAKGWLTDEDVFGEVS